MNIGSKCLVPVGGAGARGLNVNNSNYDNDNNGVIPCGNSVIDPRYGN